MSGSRYIAGGVGMGALYLAGEWYSVDTVRGASTDVPNGRPPLVRKVVAEVNPTPTPRVSRLCRGHAAGLPPP